ncbi:Hypothetical predicted protein, partial [Pelobates cultripes]
RLWGNTHTDKLEAHNHPRQQQPLLATYRPVQLRQHTTNSSKSYSLSQIPMHKATTLCDMHLNLPLSATHLTEEIIPPKATRPTLLFPTPN